MKGTDARPLRLWVLFAAVSPPTPRTSPSRRGALGALRTPFLLPPLEPCPGTFGLPGDRVQRTSPASCCCAACARPQLPPAQLPRAASPATRSAVRGKGTRGVSQRRGA